MLDSYIVRYKLYRTPEVDCTTDSEGYEVIVGIGGNDVPNYVEIPILALDNK